MESYIIIALISMVLFGTNAVILKSAKNIDPVSLTLFSIGTSALVALIWWTFFNFKRVLSLQGVGFGILSGILNGIAIVLFVIAIHKGKASIVAPISALGAGVAVILAVVFLSEKLTLFHVSGIILGGPDQPPHRILPLSPTNSMPLLPRSRPSSNSGGRGGFLPPSYHIIFTGGRLPRGGK